MVSAIRSGDLGLLPDAEPLFLIAVPDKKDSLHPAIGEAHRRYTRMINFREGWRGHLSQGRFASYVMDERYLLACARYKKHELTGRPFGEPSFIEGLEVLLDRPLKPKRPGRKPKAK